MSDQVEATRDAWNKFAVRFTETANKRMTLQCARHLHSHMQLDSAVNVLEVAAGAGLGSLDAAQYLLGGRSKLPRGTKRTFTVTDLSPVMLGLAEKHLSGVGSDDVEIKCREANGMP
jgi:ubiquinone/menaquinone biosynthesis C-methylase UbiE